MPQWENSGLAAELKHMGSHKDKTKKKGIQNT